MLSASTLSSNASTAFSAGTSATSPYSAHSTPKSSGHNPLTELIDTEKSYMETLKIIDSQLAPLWKAPIPSDFSELLSNVHNVLKANRRFCAKLMKIAANPQTIKELGDALMQWIDDMEVPYANFCRSFIADLNSREDVTNNPAIRQLLQNLSSSATYEITLETLFNAPIQQLRYYKMLYGRLLESAEPGRADHKLLLEANQRIDTVMLMAQKTNNKPTTSADHISPARLQTKALPAVTPIQTDITPLHPELAAFQKQLNCSQVTDLFTGAPLQQQCSPNFASADTSVIFRDSFVLLPEETHLSAPVRVHLVLTNNYLIIARENGNSNNGSDMYILLYPPLTVDDITVKSKMLDRELVGEYLVEFTIQNQKCLTFRADNKAIRNKWVGCGENASNSLLLESKPLPVIIQKNGGNVAHGVSGLTSRKSTIRKRDIVSFYHDQTGEISPLSSDESDSEGPDFFSKALPQDAQEEDHKVKALPAPPVLPKMPSVQASPLGDTIAPPKPPMKQSASNDYLTPTRQDNNSLLSPSLATLGASATSINSQGSEESNGGGGSSPVRPVSPRTVEISHAVAPVAMQAITQTNDYFTAGAAASSKDGQALRPTSTVTTLEHLPRTSSATSLHDMRPVVPPVMPVRSSSIRQQEFPQPHQQQRPPMLSQQHQQPPRPSMAQSSPRLTPMHGSPRPPHQGSPRPPLQRPMAHSQNIPSQKPLPQGPCGTPGSPPAHMQQQQQQQPSWPGSQQGMPRPAPPSPGLTGSRPPSPGLSPTPGYNNEPMRPAGYHLNAPPHLRPLRPMEELNSPPRSPTPHMVNGQPNGIRQVIYSNGQCEVFHWKSESWYGVDGHCVVEVRQTFSNRSCLAIQLQNTGQLYLNAWVLPNTVICHASPTDVSISVYMGQQKENYLVHFHTPQDAVQLFQILQRMHQEAVQMNISDVNSSVPMRGVSPAPPVNLMRSMTIADEDHKEENQEQVPQTLRLVMQCKTKLFVQNEHSNWSSFGSVQMKISQQLPSKKMHIEIENKSTKLVSAIVQSRNVERISPKRITFLLVNEKERQSMVYMVQIKEESTGQKIFEYLKVKNAENGW
ncbi:hypothetical protein BX666DRAFT_1949065 [Dichotomocladium elegans]|nr:hypothetical protein BX666DRAFT_1949065 [Dichotomocladium elegans]